jgi:hypothetical protein
VFGLLTPYPATPLYDKLAAAGRLTRPKHWLDFKPFAMAHTPLGFSTADAEAEVKHAWAASYSPGANKSAMRWLQGKSLADRIIHLCSRLAFRGIYFPQMKWRHWASLLFQNRQSILQVAFQAWKLKFAGDAAALSVKPAIGFEPLAAPADCESGLRSEEIS